MQTKVNIHIMRTRGLVSALTARVGLEEAKSRGLTYYWSDKVCKRGHDGWRYVSQPSACRACVRAYAEQGRSLWSCRHRPWRPEEFNRGQARSYATCA